MAAGSQDSYDAQAAALMADGRPKSRTPSKGVVLVYRTPYEDPSGKRVVKLDGNTVLEWFQRGWDAARAWKAADGDRFGLDELAIRWITKVARGYVHGLESIFAAAREHGLPAPADTKQLGRLLRKYLYTEGRTPVVDATTVRAMTDDDELELAYYLLPLTEARRRPERTAWLLHPGWRLPTRPADHGTFLHGLRAPRNSRAEAAAIRMSRFWSVRQFNRGVRASGAGFS